MLPRFSYLSNLTYDQHLIASNVLSATQGMVSGPAKDIVQATLYGNLVGAQATIRSGQEITSAVLDSGQSTVSAITSSGQATVGAIQDSTQVISGQMHNAMLANMFGSLLVSGTIAVSTALMIRRIDKIAIGVERLGAQFTEGMALVASKLDMQTGALTEIKDQLGKIHETLKSPTITQAVEYRNLGLERVQGGLWPEAMDAFKKALSLDETDPLSNMMLGELYLDAVDETANYHDPETAQSFFAKAVRYATAAMPRAPQLSDVRNQSLYFRATALMANAARLRSQGANEEKGRLLLEQALECTDNILSSTPKYHTATYLRVKLLLILERESDATIQFNTLLQEDPNYLSTAGLDKDFSELSAVGRRVLVSVEPWYRTQLKVALELFYDALELCKVWQVHLPNELLEWLRRENAVTRTEGFNSLLNSSFDALATSTPPLLSTLHTATLSLNGLFEWSLRNEFVNVTLITNEIRYAVRDTQLEYIDKSWLGVNSTSRDVLAFKQLADLPIQMPSMERIKNDPESMRVAWQKYVGVLEQLCDRCESIKSNSSRILELCERVRALSYNGRMRKRNNKLIWVVLGWGNLECTPISGQSVV